MKRKFDIIRENSWIELLLRLFLGIIFIYASIHKLMDPAQFAVIIYGYDLFPGYLINLIAIIVPYMELVSGIALVTGIYPRSAVLIINGMLFAFILALSVNLARGHVFDCGCFSFGDKGTLHSVWQLLFRDIICLIFGLHLFLFKNSRKFCLLKSSA